MTNDTFKLTTLSGLLVLAPFAAFAQLNVGDNVGTSEEAVRSALLAAGYEVIEIEVEDDEIEAEVTLDGQAFEIEIAADGTASEVEAEDGDSDDDEEDDDDK